MGRRTIDKYFSLVLVGFRIVRVMWSKIKEVRASDSPGGKDITIEEWMDLGDVLAGEIMMALPEVEAHVLLVPKDEGYGA